MSDPRQQLEREIFHDALEAPPEQWDAIVRSRCADDDSMLDRVMGLLRSHARLDAQETSWQPAAFEAAAAPKAIDSFRITKRLGEGGMGVVYAAEQTEPVRRKVAIKLLRSGADSNEVYARFHAERQALALMNHANIAQILDAGVYEGRPYFVMEYIPGVPISEYCEQRRLPIRDRLKLFMDVCQGVQHAHQKGIIHRDLKPSNVLVMETDGKPTPKIIDFGIAKAISGRLLEVSVHTEMGRIIGTPDYMSPEQADTSALDFDTRTDVYSLGAMLYELISGGTVFGLSANRAGLDEIRKTIMHKEPIKPSDRFLRDRDGAAERAASRGSDPEHLARLLRQDLDWITLKALEKSRARRYPTVTDLATDIARFLHGEPVVARPPSRTYRLSKFVRRNRVAATATSVVAVTIIVFAAIAAGFGLSEARQRAAAEEARDALAQEKAVSDELRIDAERARDQAVGMAWFLTEELLAAARPSSQSGRGRDVTMREVLDAASEKIDEHVQPGGRFENNPVVEVQVRSALGSTYFDLSLFEESERHLLRAYTLGVEHLGRTDGLVLSLLTRLGPLYYRLGRLEESERFYVEALEAWTEAASPESVDILIPLGNLGLFYKDQGRLTEAEAIYREVLEKRTVLLGPAHPDTIAAHSNLSSLLIQLGRYEEAIEVSAAALAIAREALSPDHVNTLIAMSNHGSALEQGERLEDAKVVLGEAVERSKAIFGPVHEQTATAMNNYASVLRKLNLLEEASETFHDALGIYREVYGDGHRNTIIAMTNLAGVYRENGDFTTAVDLTGEALERAPAAFSEGHWIPGVLRLRHAEALLGLGQHQEARDMADAGRAIIVAALGDESPRAFDAARVLARIYESWNEADPTPEREEAARTWRERATEEQAGG